MEEPASDKMSAEMRTAMAWIDLQMGAMPDFRTLPVVEARALDNRKNLLWNTDLPAMAHVHRIAIPAQDGSMAAGSEAIVFRPWNAQPGVILYVHGGGWAFCSPRTHERLMRVLAHETGCEVVGITYRLAPEHPFPAGLNDVVNAYRILLKGRRALGLSEGPLVIAGDSAGANLALSALVHEANAGRPMPAGAVLLCGAYAPEFTGDSYKRYGNGYGLTADIMRLFWDWYLVNPLDHINPLAAPLRATDTAIAALPPLFLVAAELDPLASETMELKARLDQLGRSDQLHVEPGVIHGFVMMTGQLAAARRVAALAAEAARSYMTASQA